MISISTRSPRTVLRQRTSGATIAPAGGGAPAAAGTFGASAQWIVVPGGNALSGGTGATVPVVGDEGTAVTVGAAGAPEPGAGGSSLKCIVEPGGNDDDAGGDGLDGVDAGAGATLPVASVFHWIEEPESGVGEVISVGMSSANAGDTKSIGVATAAIRRNEIMANLIIDEVRTQDRRKYGQNNDAPERGRLGREPTCSY